MTETEAENFVSKTTNGGDIIKLKGFATSNGVLKRTIDNIFCMYECLKVLEDHWTIKEMRTLSPESNYTLNGN